MVVNIARVGVADRSMLTRRLEHQKENLPLPVRAKGSAMSLTVLSAMLAQGSVETRGCQSSAAFSLIVKVLREYWPAGRGYEVKFIIR